MDFSLTEEQILLRESVEKYIADHGGVERHRRLCGSAAGFEPEAWQSFAELGWLALPFSEAEGGLGGSPTDLMVLCEALGRGLVREPFLHTAVTCGGMLAAGGSAQQRERFLPGLIGGGSQWAFAFAEHCSGYDFCAIDTLAQSGASGLTLSGQKIAVLNGHAADQLLVTALGRPDDRSSLVLCIVDPALPGISSEVFTAVDGSRGAEFRFADVQLPADSVLGEGVNAAALIDDVVDTTIIAMGAESVGAMQVLLDSTVEYSKTREQFGQPIGAFQALQHRMADMFLKLEEARSLLFNAAILLQQGSAEAGAACAALKVKVAEAGRFIAHEAVQLHGGIGMTDELIVGHLFKRLLLLEKLYGDGDYYLQRYGELRAA